MLYALDDFIAPVIHRICIEDESRVNVNDSPLVLVLYAYPFLRSSENKILDYDVFISLNGPIRYILDFVSLKKVGGQINFS